MKLVQFAECFHKKQEVTFPLLEENLQPILSDIDLEVVQSKHNVAEVYTWLGYIFISRSKYSIYVITLDSVSMAFLKPIRSWRTKRNWRR